LNEQEKDDEDNNVKVPISMLKGRTKEKKPQIPWLVKKSFIHLGTPKEKLS
jgi:hypothetical protein